VGHAVDLQISVSQYVADTVEGPSRTLLTGVPNRDVGPHKARTVLVAQRMEAEKDGTVAIEAWNRSKLAERGWRLLFAGAGGDRRRLEDAVERYHLVNSVSFLGFVDGVDGLMANSSMLLATAPTEPYGITVAEAMACGLPVVAAAGGGHLETVGAVTPQTMFPPGDASAAAELLRQLAGNDRLRQGLGEQLVRYQRAELSLGRHVDQLMMLYRSLTPGSGANSAAAD
jgi:glycosyltransferase involved in cell wall biosynthesis